MGFSKFLRILVWIAVGVTALVAFKAQAASPVIDVLEIKGTINPVIASYVQRGIERAESDNAVAAIIQIDTPGGLDTAMRDIIQNILNSKVPVVVYVSPAGARAASAGTYITIAADVAAMAPNTVVGAATPIQIGDTQTSDELEKKIINDAAAYIRSLAESRGRNADWAEKAVRDGVSITEQEALNINVVDMVTNDLDTLIAQLDGRETTRTSGEKVILNTRDVEVKFVRMGIIEEFLHTIADPNIAYLLLSLAALGILIEVTNPGLIFPGVVGAISGILAFYALGQLPVNWAGILFIVLAFVLFAAEAFTASFGLLLVGGLIALILGALILFPRGSPVFSVDIWLIVTVSVIIAAFFAFIINRVVTSHRRQATTGREDLIGRTAVARANLNPEGTVFFRGELWNAVSESGEVKAGEEVRVARVEGLKLYVTRK